MEQLTLNNNLLTFRDNDFIVEGFKRVDGISFEILTDQGAINFRLGQTSINSVVINSIDDLGLPEIKDPANWLGVEQALRYNHEAALFIKAFGTATDKGFSLFIATLSNGKRGESSEGALLFAFQVLGVTWDDTEKGQINEILTANNFTIQI